MKAISRSRALALALLASVVVLLALGIGYPLALMFQGADEEIDDLAFRIQRLHGVAASADYWTAKAERIRQQASEGEQFLEGNTAALAAAELQSRIKQLVEGNGGSIASTQTPPPREEQGFTRVAVSVSMSGTVETLRSVLHEVESSRPYLLVGTLSIFPDRRRTQTPGQLRVELEVYGYLRPK